MSLMAIILWALNAFSPWRRFHERTRHLLDAALRVAEDQSSLDWGCTRRDHLDSILLIERALDDLGSGIDLLIYQRAREILGLNPGPFRRPGRSPPQNRRARSFDELLGRIEACTIRFTDIERLAQRRAEKMKRLLEPSEVQLDEPAHAIFAKLAACLTQSRRLVSPKPTGVGGSPAKAEGGSHAGTLGARAPPARLPIAACPPPQRPARLRPRICAQTTPARPKPQAAWTSPLDFALSGPPRL